MMYRYLYKNQVRDALGFLDARKQIGLALPENIHPLNYFMIRLWRWDEEEKDYSIEIFDAPGHQVFNGYEDGLTCFNALQADHPEEEVKLQLIQVHLGEISTLQSKILFPTILAGEP